MLVGVVCVCAANKGCRGMSREPREENNLDGAIPRQLARRQEHLLTPLPQRNLPAKGFRPGILLLGMGAVMGYGWYKLVHGIREAKYVFSLTSPPLNPRHPPAAEAASA